MKTGYNIREGSRIIAERIAEDQRKEQVRQARLRASWAIFLDKRYSEKAA